MHTYLLLVPPRTYIRIYVHTLVPRLVFCLVSHFFSFRLPFLPFIYRCMLARTLLSPLSVHHRSKCLVAIPSGIDIQYTDFYTSRLIADTRLGIRYTSDFLSIKLVSCGQPRNLRFRRCRMIFTWLVKVSRVRDSLSSVDEKYNFPRGSGKISFVSADY